MTYGMLDMDKPIILSQAVRETLRLFAKQLMWCSQHESASAVMVSPEFALPVSLVLMAGLEALSDDRQ